MAAGKLLVVDDDSLNREIIREYLEGERLDVAECEDGQIAWDRLSTGESFDAVILDRMMPRMNGMELLEKMKADANLRTMPVIMQTAAAASDQVAEGINLGAFYYLTKPYERTVFLAVVKAALEFGQQRAALTEDISSHKGVVHLAQSATYFFSTLDDARALAVSLSGAAASPSAVGLGLVELMVNAVEHGNLGITYEEKSRLLTDGDYYGEVVRRMGMESNKGRYGVVKFSRHGADIVFHVIDQGDGFNWRKFLELDPQRALAPCGRGIAMARVLAFSSMEYLGKGNEVIVRAKAAMSLSRLNEAKS